MKPEIVVPGTGDLDEERFLQVYLKRRSKSKRLMQRKYNRAVRRSIKRKLKNNEDL